MTEEIWKPVVGWEGRHEVSSMGRVRSIYVAANTPPPPRYLGGTLDKNGYLRIGFMLPDKRVKLNPVHRLVASAFLRPPNPKEEVNHKNGIKSDNRIENLEWVTTQQNHYHSMITGLKASGERQGQAALTEEQVIEIRATKGITFKQIAAKYGVTVSAVNHIKQFRCWKNKRSFPRTGHDPLITR